MYVVPHCHWDAEWYFTCEDSHILLVENMDYLLDLLEKDADFPSYTFDGLAIVLDDYLKERPENTSRIHALIRQRRLFVGPWYTQCDSLLIRTESLIRNLQYGIRTATQFGHSMNVGYLPDIFGQHAWLPAFFTDAGIDFCVLQRGIYTDQLRGDLNFYWRAPNQKSIATNYLYYGYGPGKFLSAEPDYLQHRLISVERSALSLINLLKKKISHAISLQSEQRNILVVFNSDISPLDSLVQAVVFTKDKQVSLRRGGKPVACTVLEQRRLDGGQQVIVTAQGEKLETVEGYYRSVILFRADGLHGLGYQTWLIDEQTASPSLTLSHEETIENTRLRISLHQGVLSLENRGTGQRIDNLLTFVDCGDDGDEFDFAPVEHEQPVSVSTFTLIACETSPMVSRMTLETTLVLPKDMQQRRNAAPTQPMTIQTTLELRQHENYVRVQHHLVNEAHDHRLRVHIRTPVKAPDYAFADQGYALLRRETRSRYVNGWREQGFVEKPVPVYTLENCVALRDDNHLFAAITKGIKEYEVLPDEDVLALTLFRSVGLLGKDDTPWRPGRASGINNKIVDTPDAQMLQPMTFDYALMMDSAIDDAALFNACKQYREHYLSYQLQQLNTFEERLERFTIPLPEKGLAPAFTWLTQNNPAIQMSMCKPGDGEHTVIIRLFNPGDTPQTVELASPFTCRIYRLSLLEEIQETVKDNPTIAAKDYLTLALHLMQDHSHE
ncbi:alpha-mannosidase [Cronobacter sakazakii]|uniref:glycoside hydrolase family 38 N-terminal domain-containing protein n=1 Tax=Cronobacter sakazakii TaxID=28141 RepID=UPI000BE8391A|nr:glycoside hydrolase family 38 C-terminal domain-containing protein [Cronobacter sakazakii]ELY6201042.1 alpha-mannosidase [Cronobacter sakazakii]EMD7609672.1 alpha-mannosidase [Cronobacter sakazakii]NHV94109.1 alpha-mannosidase [Cronobacter sakazakii]PQV66392.1 alpha-mannosidase [Cronobacter sakazakii]PQY20876.1 alpha-mannosidase [Cronobacter sakazakii]